MLPRLSVFPKPIETSSAAGPPRAVTCTRVTNTQRSAIRTIQGHGSGDRLGQHETYLLAVGRVHDNKFPGQEKRKHWTGSRLGSGLRFSISSRTEALDFQPVVKQNMVPPMIDQAIEENLGFSGKRKKTKTHNPRVERWLSE